MSFPVFLSKWLHLLSIAGIVGWTAYAWIGLSPALRQQAGSDLSRQLWRRFGIGIGVLWVVALLTGFYNAAGVAARTNSLYHAWLGAKIALALATFIATVAIAHPVPGFQALQRARYSLLAVVVALAIGIVGVSAYLNLSRTVGFGLASPNARAPAAPASPASGSAP